ncbi:hypothetical protein C8J56DRAFT_1038066 [Mycena floridula]|nr:hypothetical protein C8J56DRAFT_1038066 [Mycena floridula]
MALRRHEITKIYMNLEEYAPKVTKAFESCYWIPATQKDHDLALSCRVRCAKELLAKEDETVRDEMKKKRKAAYKADKEKHQKFLNAFGMNTDLQMADQTFFFDEEMQAECGANSAAIVQPLLNALHHMMGEWYTVLSGCPPKSADPSEKWVLRSLHVGRIPGTSQNFFGWNQDSFRNQFMPLFMSFLWAVGRAIPKAIGAPSTAPVVDDSAEATAGEPAETGGERGMGKAKQKEKHQKKKNKCGSGHTASNRHLDSESSTDSGDSKGEDDDDESAGDELSPQSLPLRDTTPVLPDGMVVGEFMAKELKLLNVQTR